MTRPALIEQSLKISNGIGGRRNRKKRKALARKAAISNRRVKVTSETPKPLVSPRVCQQLRRAIIDNVAKQVAEIVMPQLAWPGPQRLMGIESAGRLPMMQLSTPAESRNSIRHMSATRVVVPEKFNEGLSKLFITQSDGSANVAVFKDGAAKAYLLYIQQTNVPGFDGPAYAAHGVGPESAYILLAAWQMARELGLISRHVYVVGRTFIVDRIWRGNEGKREARFRLTAASRMVEILLPRPRPAGENMFCNIRWRRRPL